MTEEKDKSAEPNIDKLMNAPSVAEGFDRIDGKSPGVGGDQPPVEKGSNSLDVHEPPQPTLEPKPPSLGDQGDVIDPKAAKSLNTTPSQYKSRTERLSEKYSGDLSKTFSRTNGRKM